MRKLRSSTKSAKELYPAMSSVLFWGAVASVRVGILASIAAQVAHPFVVDFATSLGSDEMTAFFGLCFSVHTAMVILGSVFFWVLDTFGLLQQYKLRRDPATPENAPGLMGRAMLFIAAYHMILRFAICRVLWALWPYPSFDGPSPDFSRLFPHFVVTYWASELFKYVFHYVQHEVTWLRWMHRPHHEFVQSQAAASEYSDMAELSVFTVLSFLHTVQLHPVVHLVTIVWKVSENLEVHSGYCFRGSWLNRLGLLHSARTEMHDFHHTHPGSRGPYGKPLLFDYIFHTADDWVTFLAKEGRDPMLSRVMQSEKCSMG